jgi:hypothetical protein
MKNKKNDTFFIRTYTKELKAVDQGHGMLFEQATHVVKMLCNRHVWDTGHETMFVWAPNAVCNGHWKCLNCGLVWEIR